MPSERVLLLGGTNEAHDVAKALINAGFRPLSSLAGVTASPHMPVGEVRRGGFGGEEGLAQYVNRENLGAIIDATHPYAAQISRHAHGAAQRAKVPYLRLERTQWRTEPGDRWVEVAGVADAVAALPRNARVFVTIGGKEVAAFFARPDLQGAARMIEAPSVSVPARWTLIQARPPFSLDDEIRLLEHHGITHLVSKNSGGELTRAKIIAARERNIPVVMVVRPVKPAPSFSSAGDLIAALRQLLSP